MADDERILSEEQARRLWQRAAELQAEAAQRLEERSRALVRPDAEAGGGYHLAHVRQAAREAGISDEFVELALAESPGEGPGEAGWDRWADRFLGRGPRTLVATRTFDHAARDLYAAMQRVFPRYRLSLVDSRGSDPLDGGVLVFDLPSVWGFETFDPVVNDLRMWADIKELHVQIRPLDEDRCEVTLRAPVAYARKVNLGVGVALAGVFGAAGAVMGAVLSLPLVGLLALGPVGEVVAVLLAATVGALGMGLASRRVLRALYGWGQGKGTSAMERVLQALGVDLRTGGVFQAPPGAGPSLPPGQSAT